MDIDFTRLRYFVAVAEELHFKRAADRLLITPPPLSKQIRVLEQELGGPLFDRDYHEVRLTALGRELLAPARAILAQVDAFKATAAHATKTSGGAIRIGATAYASASLMDRVERALERPDAPADLQILGSALEVADRLIAGRIELGIIHLPAGDERIRWRVIGEVQGAVAVRADDPLAARASIRVEELRDRKVVSDAARANPPLQADFERELAARGVHQIVHPASGRGGEVELAAQVYHRRLVAIVGNEPESFLGRIFSPPRFALVPIDPDSWPPSRIALAWLPDRVRRDPRLAAFVDELAAAIAAVPQAA